VVTLARLRAKTENITIVENYSREAPLIHGSSEQLKQVFLNLFTNATDAMPNGGKIEVETTVQDNHIIVTVADTGVGIPSHLVPKIFDPLFTTKENGSGLGLTVSLSIVRDHGGTINIESVENHGRKFTVTLPRLEQSRGKHNA
jgi:signal transduction histidine kinase